ncbi:MAG: hypothetical protein ACW972_00495 [Promethearchaeota archaeon]|jgi:hypothetical protein
MSDDNNREFFLPIRNLIQESLIRDIIIFAFIFILVNTQGWMDIFLLVFPLVTFGFSLFFRIINSNKWRTEFENGLIVYNPLGLEKKHANRLSFSALVQLLLMFWLGAESLYNPHLVEGYFLYFNLLFFFTFSFGFFWIFIDMWKYSRMEIIFDKSINKDTTKNKSNRWVKKGNVLSSLNIQRVRIISIINFLGFIILNIINILIAILIFINPSIGIQVNLPGTGIMGSEPLKISLTFYFSLFISPLLTAVSLYLNYRDINKFQPEKLEDIIKNFPPNIQIQIVENLKGLNEKLKKQMNIE